MSNSLSKRLVAFANKPAVRRSFIGVASLVVIFNLVGYFVLPHIIKSQAEKMVAEKLHRRLAVGKVEVNPYALVVTARDVRLMEAQGDAVFAAFEALTINVSTESLLRLAPVVQELRLTKPYAHLIRLDAHRYNLDDIVAQLASQPPSAEPARFSINNIQVENGHIDFEDRPARTTHVIADLALGVPFISSLPSDVQIFVEPLLSAKANGTPLLFKGKARPFAEPRDAIIELDLDGLDITRYLDYLPFRPRFKVPGGRLDTHLTASFRQFKDKAPALVLTGEANLKSLHVAGQDGKPVLKLAELALTLGNMDVFGGRIEVARVAANGLQADVTRDRGGQLNLLRLLPPSGPAATPATEPAALRLAVEEVQLRDASVRYTDENAARPMHASLQKLNVSVRKVAVDTGVKTVTVGEVNSGGADFLLRQNKPARDAEATPAKDAASGNKARNDKAGSAYAVKVGRIGIDNWSGRLEDQSQPQPAVTLVSPVRFSMTELSTAASSSSQMELSATINKTGRIAMKGGIGMAPLQTDLAMELKNVDILPLQPYVTDWLNLRFTSASLSGKGRLQLQQGTDGALKGGYKGDLRLDNLATVDKASASDFLRWKSLTVGGMDLRLQPLALAVDEVALNDFFARVIIDPSGRINIQDVTRTAMGRKSLTENVPAAARSGASNAPAAQETRKGRMPPVSIRKLSLSGGRVRFTDNFIRPNYSANLMNFGGTVTGLSSDPTSNATVALRGEVNRAPLSIAGRVNPLRGDLFLDVTARVRGMELATLSPYSGRYLGYGIEKGKLSFEVAYRVENRNLSAENRLILDQLTFGDRIDSPNALKLPIQLAVALLRDSNGIIDVNVPVGGSLDDPQFSIGGIILKVIGNAIVKAVTKPFALLGAMFGGGEELSSLAFEPGRAIVPPAGEAKLKSLAKALDARPALKLEITGHADPETDTEGLKRASIDRKVRALKLKDLQARGVAIEPGSATVKADEYPDLLRRVFREEKFPKPRNVIGLQKSLPVEEMERLMMEHATVGEDDLRTLGNRRAQAVKDWLVKFGEVPDERIFILASRIGGAQPDAGDAGGAPGRVDFSLR
jgi:uncharacterized protein involved in outer membrane biogenesis